MQLLNNDYLNNYIKPYVADLGIALAFGVGYFIFKSLKKEEKVLSKDVKQQIQQSLSKWSMAKSLHKFNNLIMANNDKSSNAFHILDSISKAELVPDVTTYNCLLVMSYRLDQINEATRLIQLMKDPTHHVQPDIVTFNIILKSAVKEIKENFYTDKSKTKETVHKVKAILDEIKKKGLNPDSFTYNTILDAYVEAGELELALQCFDGMGNGDLAKPDVYTYTTMIKGLKNSCQDKNLEKILEIYRMIKDSNEGEIKLDEFIANSVLDSCIKFGKINQAIEIFNSLKSNGVCPSVVTYSIIMKGLGNDGKINEAISLLSQMKLEEILPNEVIYDCLLNCAIKSQNLECMKNIYKMMVKDGITPNSVILSTLIKGFNRTKNYELAFSLFKNLTEDQFNSIDIVFYNSLLDCCVESGNQNMLNEVYQALEKRTADSKGFITPTVITYSTMLKGYTKVADIEKAETLYNQYKSTKGYVDEVFFNIMADFYGKQKDERKILGVLRDMKFAGVIRSSVIYSIIIKMYSQIGEENKALAMYEEMKKEGIKPTLITSTSIMQMFIKQKKMDNAVTIFYELRRGDIPIDVVTYNFIINGCSFNKKLETAIEILLDSLRANVILSENTYNNVLEYLISNKFMKNSDRCNFASVLVRHIKEKNINIKYEIYTKLVKLLYKTAPEIEVSKEVENFSKFSKSGFHRGGNFNSNSNYGYNSNYNNYGQQRRGDYY